MKLVNREVQTGVQEYNITIRTHLQMTQDYLVYNQILDQLVFPLEAILEDNQRWYVKRSRQV